MRIKHLILLVVLLLAPISPALPAQAEGVVTSCDAPALRAALAGGGTVTFACSGTITTYETITISTDTTIDGSGQAVTITGNNLVRVFVVDPGVTLNLNAMTVANGAAGSFDVGGGVLNLGVLNVTNSTFYGNSAGVGGGIYNHGAMTLSNSLLFGNSANNGGGGGIRSNGTLTVSGSTLAANRADHGLGGAIESGFATVMITDSIFLANSAMGGGAIDLHNGTAILSNNLFLGNRGVDAFNYFGGGAIRTEGATVAVSNSTFSDNDTNRSGGGIFNYGGGSLHISASTFSGNSATGAGGGISSTGTTTVSNSTLHGNSAGYAGGGICNWGPLGPATALTVTNSTLSDNSSANGGGIYNHPDNTLTLMNSIVANSSAGNNCLGPIAGAGNLSYPDASCPGSNANPMLGPLRDNGGPTLTMEPDLASPAINSGDETICQSDPVNGRDQRGVTRPVGPYCDIGAVEVDYLPHRKWFPVAHVE
jgi:predicted outer membrane repeat protein